jgi:hypothetical protein
MAGNSEILQEISDAKKEQAKPADAPVAEKPAAAQKQKGAPAPVAEKPAPEK